MKQNMVDEFEILDDSPQEKLASENAALKQSNIAHEAQVKNLSSEINELQQIIEQRQSKIKDLEQKIQLLSETSIEEKDKSQRLITQFEQNKSVLLTQQKQQQDQLELRIVELQKQISKLREQMAKENSQDSSQGAILEAQIIALNKDLAQEKLKTQNCEQTVSDFMKNFDDINKEKKLLEDQERSLKDKVTNLEKELSAKVVKEKEINNKLTSQEKELTDKLASKDQEMAEKLAAQEKELKDKIIALEKDLVIQQSKHKGPAHVEGGNANEVNLLQTKLQASEKENDSLRKQVQTLSENISAGDWQLHQMESELNKLKQSSSDSNTNFEKKINDLSQENLALKTELKASVQQNLPIDNIDTKNQMKIFEDEIEYLNKEIKMLNEKNTQIKNQSSQQTETEILDLLFAAIVDQISKRSGVGKNERSVIVEELNQTGTEFVQLIQLFFEIQTKFEVK